LLLSFALPQFAMADENIYAPDVRRAERGLERAQSRLAHASADVQQADQMLPSARAASERLTRRADGPQHLIGFGASKGHLSLYVTDSVVLQKYEQELAAFDHAGTKTTVRFTVDKPLPRSLVKKIVKTRTTELNG
jgi:hypothetical protein